MTHQLTVGLLKIFSNILSFTKDFDDEDSNDGSITDTEEKNSTIDCGVFNEETMYKISTCSFWMEGVILTGTGK